MNVAVADFEALGHLGCVGVNRCQIRCCGIVGAKPDYTADDIGEGAAGLADEPEAGLLRGDSPFIDIGLAVELELHRAPAVRKGIAARTDILGHVQRSAFVMVTHDVGYILDSHFLGRLDKQREAIVGIVAQGMVEP